MNHEQGGGPDRNRGHLTSGISITHYLLMKPCEVVSFPSETDRKQVFRINLA
ncbi:MAG: hypothetical protein ABI444_12625 [Candidatus Kapaibacterium sp.]